MERQRERERDRERGGERRERYVRDKVSKRLT